MAANTDAIYQEQVARFREMLFHSPLIGNPLPGTNLAVNRIPYSTVIPDSNNMEEMFFKGQTRVNDFGFAIRLTEEGEGQQTLYRAISFGLTGTENDHLSIFRIGIRKMRIHPRGYNKYGMSKGQYLKYLELMEESGRMGQQGMDPHDLLLAAADALSVRFVIFNARGEKIALDFAPPAGTVILRTAYVLCVPDINSLSCAYALERIPWRIRGNAEPSNTREDVRADRIWRQHTRVRPLISSWKQDNIIRRIKSRPNLANLRCIYEDPSTQLATRRTQLFR